MNNTSGIKFAEIKSMNDVIEILKQCKEFAEGQECEVHYDDTCVAKTEIKQSIEKCIKYIEENYPRTLRIMRSRDW